MPASSTRRALSLFAGCGGFWLGIEQAGYQLAVAVERDKAACQTYANNFPTFPLFSGDVRDFLSRGSDHVDRYHLHDIDLVYGGPPCQGHSSIGARDPIDERNQLWKEFARIVDGVRPRAFIMENVPGILSSGGGKFKRDIIDNFKNSGYQNATVVGVDAADFGVPQHRKRVLFIGTRDDLRLPDSLDTLLNTGLEAHHQEYISVDQAISDLPEAVCEPGHLVEYASRPASRFQSLMRRDLEQVSGHHTKKIGIRRAHLISHLKPGSKADSLPPELWDGIRAQKWRRFDGRKPAHTLLAQMGKDLSEWVHPHFERWITLREAARLQGFPDNFLFPCSESAALTQVGNSVPPPLSRSVGVVVREILDGSVTARRRGRPSLGLKAMSAGERHARWRAGTNSGSIELPGELIERIRELCDETGHTRGCYVLSHWFDSYLRAWRAFASRIPLTCQTTSGRWWFPI